MMVDSQLPAINCIFPRRSPMWISRVWHNKCFTCEAKSRSYEKDHCTKPLIAGGFLYAGNCAGPAALKTEVGGPASGLSLPNPAAAHAFAARIAHAAIPLLF